MADCLNISRGRDLACKNAVGGVRNAFLINFSNDISFTTSASTITAISGLTVDEVFQYELKATTNTLSQEATTSRDNGTTFWTQTMVLNLAKVDAEMTNQLRYMAVGRLWAVIQDAMGNYQLLGKVNGVDVTASTIASGGAMGDFNGYTITLTGEEMDPAEMLSETAIVTLLANVADNA